MFEDFEVIKNADLRNFCTFKIGGKGTIVFPKNIYELKKLIKVCANFFILGNGSNLLFPDGNLKTILISLRHFNVIKVLSKKRVYVEAGVNLFTLNYFLKNNNLGGLEWSFGIPASVGGAVFMNAGAFGHSISERVESVKVLKSDRVSVIKGVDINFSYRKSNIDGVILGVVFKCEIKDKKEIEQEQNAFLECRKSTQPFNKNSAGSVFKRNGKILPAKIIDECGLKGCKSGDAEISQKHAGFIINNKNAKASDVLSLIKFIQEKTGKNFELEIIILK